MRWAFNSCDTWQSCTNGWEVLIVFVFFQVHRIINKDTIWLFIIIYSLDPFGNSYLVQVFRHNLVDAYWEEEQCMVVVGTRLVAEVVLHWPNYFIHLFCQTIHIQRSQLKWWRYNTFSDIIPIKSEVVWPFIFITKINSINLEQKFLTLGVFVSHIV